MYLLGNRKFKYSVTFFYHCPDIFVYYSYRTTLLGCNYNIYCNPKAIKSAPSTCFSIYFSFNLSGLVAFTFHVNKHTLNGLVYWQCPFLNFDATLLSW